MMMNGQRRAKVIQREDCYYLRVRWKEEKKQLGKSKAMAFGRGTGCGEVQCVAWLVPGAELPIRVPYKAGCMLESKSSNAHVHAVEGSRFQTV
jgi:hypothetical protein